MTDPSAGSGWLTEATPPFRVLTVCTGNVCRSPLAERLIAHWAEDALGAGQTLLTVASAGTGAPVGEPMSEWSAVIATEHGADPAGHAARQLTIPILAETDLILAATPRHRTDIVRLYPRANRHTFTIRQIGALAGAALEVPVMLHGRRETSEDLRQALNVINAQRGLVTAPTGTEEDIVDPIGGDETLYRQMEAQMVPPLEATFRALLGTF